MPSPDDLMRTVEFAGVDGVTLASTKRCGDLLFVSGQVPTRDGELQAVGLVGAAVDLATAQRCAWQCAQNVVAAVSAEIGGLAVISSVVRLGVYVASADGFTDQPLVGHGASRLILDVFGPTVGAHTRTAIGVKALPLDAPVEVDAIFALRS